MLSMIVPNAGEATIMPWRWAVARKLPGRLPLSSIVLQGRVCFGTFLTLCGVRLKFGMRTKADAAGVQIYGFT